ncbi:MAG: nucleotidyltransferase family protein [Candidatus Poribacteria bacterium]|nr:nucleotidyltransferase family protein [Candidatus Poribacteria bacterium]
MSKEHAYKNLVRLVGKPCLSEQDIRQVEIILRKSQNIDATTLFGCVRVQRVMPQVYFNFQQLKKKGIKTSVLEQFLTQAEPYIKEKRQIVAALLSDLEAFAAAAEKTGVHFMVIKGACVQSFYTDESFRQFGDVDLVISKESVWQGMKVFEQIGYHAKRIRLESYPYSEDKNEQGDGTYGIAQMIKIDSKHKCFDLHLGAFPGCGDSILESNLWNESGLLEIGSQRVLVPSPEGCILMICAHISRHGYAPLKELNDIYLLLRHTGDHLDWDHLYDFSRKNALQVILYGLLDRLKRDYDVDIPDNILSKLKLKRHEIPISKMLFYLGKEKQSFHGRRQLFIGRFLQGAFLLRYYLDRTNFLAALKESLSGLYYLFRTGRPYRLWKQREVQSLCSNRRIVIVPIGATTNNKGWKIEEIHLQKIEQFALKLSVSVEWISKAIIVWNVGHPNELIFTPEGIYTQSAYSGDIDEVEWAKIQSFAWDLICELKEGGAIEAKRISLSK